MPDVYGAGWMPHLPVEFLVWLATSPPRLWVYGLRSVHGVFRFFHLLGMAGFLGMLLLIEVKRLGFFRDSSIRDARIPMLTLMNTAFAVTLLSGIALFLYDPIGVGLHTMFLPKLLLIVLGLLHAYGIERMPAMRHQALRRATAVVALLIWTLVIGASTWNAMEQPLNPADVHRRDPSLK
jgi:lysylphosphatidylglycerol synthetase-like protein (DUF2156 family)